MSRVQVALAAGLTLIAVAIAVTLSGAPAVVARSSPLPAKEQIAITEHSAIACQAGEAMPSGTSAIRLSLAAFTGPRATARVYSGSHLVVQGERGTGWTGSVLTIPVKPLARSYADVRVCVSIDLAGDERVEIFGTRTKHAVAALSGNGQPLRGRMQIEYMRPGDRTWWSMVTLVARHMGFGNFAGGAWNVVLAMALVIAVAAVSSRLILREIR